MNSIQSRSSANEESAHSRYQSPDAGGVEFCGVGSSVSSLWSSIIPCRCPSGSSRAPRVFIIAKSSTRKGFYRINSLRALTRKKRSSGVEYTGECELREYHVWSYEVGEV